MLNQSLKELGDTLLHNRMLAQQSQDADLERAMRTQQFGATAAHQKRLEDLESQRLTATRDEADWRRDPTNPSNLLQGAQTSHLEAQTQLLQGAKINATWTDATGVKRTASGSNEEIAGTLKANPPKPDENIALKFTMANGAVGSFDGTPQQFEEMQTKNPWMAPTRTQAMVGQSSQAARLAQAELYRQKADAAADPATRARYIRYAEQLEAGESGFEETVLERDPTTGAVVRRIRTPIGSRPPVTASGLRMVRGPNGNLIPMPRKSGATNATPAGLPGPAQSGTVVPFSLPGAGNPPAGNVPWPAPEWPPGGDQGDNE